MTRRDRELFEVGSHITDASGMATVWVITSVTNLETATTTTTCVPSVQQVRTKLLYTDAWYPTDGTYTVGDTIDLLLEPAPVEFDQAGMDCAWIAANVTTLATTYDAATQRIRLRQHTNDLGC